MIDHLEIGSVPVDEPCAQLGSEKYDASHWSRIECAVYAEQLRRVYGPEPAGATLYTKSNRHDFGTYLEVAVRYDEDDEAATDYAYKCEAGLDTWDDISKAKLAEAGYPFDLIQ